MGKWKVHKSTADNERNVTMACDIGILTTIDVISLTCGNGTGWYLELEVENPNRVIIHSAPKAYGTYDSNSKSITFERGTTWILLGKLQCV